MPGPGQYEIKSQFRPSQSVDGADQNDDDEEEEYDAQDKAPFGSRQQVKIVGVLHVHVHVHVHVCIIIHLHNVMYMYCTCT